MAPFFREQPHHGRTCPHVRDQCTHKHPHSWVCYSSQATGIVFIRKKNGKMNLPHGSLGCPPNKPQGWQLDTRELFVLPSFRPIIKTVCHPLPRGQPAAAQLPRAFMYTAQVSIPFPTSRTFETQHVQMTDRCSAT